MKYLFLLLTLSLGLSAHAQQLDLFLGTWEGELTQQKGGLQMNYDYKIVFSKIEASKLIGKAYITYKDDVSMNGTLSVEAILNGKRLTIFDKEVLKNLDEEVGYWCIKTLQTELSEKGEQYILTGPWTALGSCPGGTISISKANKPTKINTAPTEEIADRKVEIKDKVHVENKEVIIKIWDGNREDGDILSLKLNGEWILKNHLLKNEKETIKVQLKKGENTLILHAENLGEIPPNTAALSIDDGTRVRKIVLRSDQMKSEALQIYIK